MGTTVLSLRFCLILILQGLAILAKQVPELIIDTDPGVDDASALILALSNAAQGKAKIHAITLVNGNSFIQEELINCYRVLKLMNSTKIPVHIGANASILGEQQETGYFGKDGFGDRPDVEPTVTKEEAEGMVSKENAVNAIIRLSRKRPGKITLVALGPMTNIALAQRMEPNLKNLLKKVILLGGTKHAEGNVKASVEFNFNHDPEAAHIAVKELDAIIVPLETVQNQGSTWEWRDKLLQIPTRTAQFISAIEEKTSSKIREAGDKYTFSDQVAIAIALDPQISNKTIRRRAVVELNGRETRGAIIVDWREKIVKASEANVELLMKFNLKGVQELMMDAVAV